MVHQARAYPSFSSMKQLGVFLLPTPTPCPGSDASSSQGYSQHDVHHYPFIHLGRGREMSPARAQIQTAWSRDEHTNHEITMLPTCWVNKYYKLKTCKIAITCGITNKYNDGYSKKTHLWRCNYKNCTTNKVWILRSVFHWNAERFSWQFVPKMDFSLSVNNT